MDFFKVTKVCEARHKMLDEFSEFTILPEKVGLIDGVDRILSEDVIANIDVPHFNKSTVDGYAVNTKDTIGCSETIPSFLILKGKVEMGKTTQLSISMGEAVYVPTGGIIPDGSDAVVMIEYVEMLDETSIAIQKPVSPCENILFRGNDIQVNQVIFNKGKRLSYQDIAVLAAVGKSKISVYQKPSFYIISTGDEIIELDKNQDLCDVFDINGYALWAFILRLGGEIKGKVIVGDDIELLKNAIETGNKCSDIVILSGGSSVGAKDFTKTVIESVEDGSVFVHGLAIKPGKPTIIGKIKNKPIVGLPGHPLSSSIIFKIIVEYFIRIKTNQEEEKPKVIAKLSSNLHSAPGRITVQMVNISQTDGITIAHPIYFRPGMISVISKADGFIMIDENKEGLNQGEEVLVYEI